MRGVIAPVHSLIVPPVEPPLDVEYVKKHVKAVSDSDDVLIASWIEAARQYFEEYTGRQIITATWELWLDAFPWSGRIELPHPPLQSVVSVDYVDGDGTLQTFDDGASPVTVSYAVKAPQGPYATPGWIEPLSGLSWPTTRTETGAVRIQYIAGYGDDTDVVPDAIKAVLCYHIAHLDQFRSAVVESSRGAIIEVPMGMQQILEAFKYSALPTTVLRTTDWGVSSWR